MDKIKDYLKLKSKLLGTSNIYKLSKSKLRVKT